MNNKVLIPVLALLIIIAGGYFGYHARTSNNKPVITVSGVSTPVSGDNIINASIAEPSILNPVLASDSASFDIIDLVFNGLLKYDKDIKLTGDLAESWEVAADNLTITFHLRQNVK